MNIEYIRTNEEARTSATIYHKINNVKIQLSLSNSILNPSVRHELANEKKDTGKRKIELLDEFFSIKKDDLEPDIIDYKDVSKAYIADRFLFIIYKEIYPIAIPMRVFKSFEEKSAFIDILNNKCTIKTINKYTNLGILEENLSEKDFSKDQLDEIFLKETFSKKSYIKLACCYSFGQQEKIFKRVILLDVLVGILSIFLLTLKFTSVFYTIPLILLIGIILLVTTKSILYKDKRCLKKYLKKTLTTKKVNLNVLVTDKNIHLKINNKEKIYGFERVKSIRKFFVYFIIVIKDENNLNIPIIISTISPINRDNKNKFINKITDKFSKLGLVQESMLDEQKFKKKKFIGGAIYLIIMFFTILIF